MLASATMKVPRIIPLGVTVGLDATACLALAGALAPASYHDRAPDPGFVHTLRAALEACAIVAATDTLRDANVPERAMLADTRRVWGAHDHATRRDDNPRSPRP
jgi:hypothetical protein